MTTTTLRFGEPRVRVRPPRAPRPYTPPRGLFRPRRRPVRTAALLILDVAVTAAILALVALGIGPHVYEYRTLTMLTASMRPHYPPGSVVVVTPTPASSLVPGDVITFHAPTEDRRVVTHRVTAVEHDGSQVRVVTKGDANNADDPWGEFVINGSTVWKARGAVPLVGHAVAHLRRPEVQFVMTRGLPLLLLGWLLVSVWRSDDASY